MNILIIKKGAMGDVIRSTSILPGIKEKYPSSKIYWLVEQGSQNLLFNNPYISKIFTNTEFNIAQIQNMRFDWIINLEEDYDSSRLTRQLRPKKISGNYLDKNNKIVPTPSAKEWYDMSLLGEKPQNDILKKKNKKTYQQMLLDICEIKNPRSNEIFYRLNNRQKQLAKDFQRRYNISSQDLIIGINTGAGIKWPSKNLNETKTAKLIDELYRKYNAKILLFGGPNEKTRNEKIISMTKSPVIMTGCGNDLLEFPALISICNIFITTDTMGLHMSLALKRRTIALFGPTSAPEIEMYGLGAKVISKSKDICSYDPNCTSMGKIDVNKVLEIVKKEMNLKISIVITAFKEPNVDKAIDSVLEQDIPYEYELIVAAPDIETKNLVEKYAKKNKQIRYFKDPGKGKSYALNLLFRDLEKKSDILILTDGDVVLGKNSIREIARKFKDPQVGCVTGRVMSSNSKKDMLGYWSHLLADAGAHKIRKELDIKDSFLECSGYLFAFRNIIRKIPLDVAEDTYIPYVLYEKGYKIRYADLAQVYVKNPTTFKDWIKQRKRTAKAHETLHKYVDVRLIPRVKSFKNEAKKGMKWALEYPRNLREYLWTINLIFARLYMWGNVFLDTKFKKKEYVDGWERIETTK